MKLRYDSAELCTKEEGDPSHMNQAHDKHVAKNNKSNDTEYLLMLRSTGEITKEVAD